MKVSTNSQGTKKKGISFMDLMSVSIGQIIGSGIMILTGIAIGLTGKGVAWSFIAAAILIIIPITCLAALGSAIPSNGGMYTYVRDLIGRKTAFFYVALLVAGQLVLANYAIGFAEYAKEFLPNLNTTLVAGVIMTLIFFANLRGLKTAVFIQNIMVVMLLAALGLFIAFGLPQVKDFGSFFEVANIMPSGFMGFVSATFLVRFALIGAEYLSELGGECENPGKEIPRAMILSTAIVAIVYFFMGVVASGVLPVGDVAFQTLGSVAKQIFPPAVYVFFIVGGAMFALVSSLNAVFAWCTRGIKMAIVDGWLPEWLAVENKRYGTPHLLLGIFYVVGMLPIITGGTIEYIAIIGNNIGLIFAVFPVLAVMFLPKRNPEAYEKAYFKLPLWAMYALPLASAAIYAFGFYSSADFIGAFGLKVMAGYCALVTLYAWIREPKVKKLEVEKAKATKVA